MAVNTTRNGTKLHTKAESNKLQRAMEKDPEKILSILRNKELTNEEKAAQIESLSGIENASYKSGVYMNKGKIGGETNGQE